VIHFFTFKGSDPLSTSGTNAVGQPTLEELRKIALDAIIRPAIKKKKTTTTEASLADFQHHHSSSHFWERVGTGLEEEEATTDRGDVIVANTSSTVTAARDPFLLSDLNTRDIVYQDILEEDETTTLNVTVAEKMAEEEEKVQAVYAETTTLDVQDGQDGQDVQDLQDIQDEQTETSR
jgi:hypothetical protein